MNIIKYPLNNEKSIKLMEAENKLIFVVDIHASKADVKEALQDQLQCTVDKVNTMIAPNGKKKAYVAFGDDTEAIDIATNLGLM